MKIKGAIFDADGTLLDSMVMWDNICVEFLTKRGITPEKNLSKIFNEMSLKQSAKYYQDNYNIKLSEEEIIAEINEMIAEFYNNEALLKDGVKEFLEYLHKNGVKMCVATLTDDYLIESALKRNNADKYFMDILTAGNVGVSKDNPLIFEKARELLGTEKEETYVFEDSYFAILTAKKAGLKTVGIYDITSEQNTEKIKAETDFYVNSFNEMRNYFD